MTRFHVLLAFGVPLLLAVPAFADADDPGQMLYLRYCGACHGPAGKGDGVAGKFMRPKPADLTGIAKAHGGAFPFDETMKVVDGRNSVRAHGDPDMPVWGETMRAARPGPEPPCRRARYHPPDHGVSSGHPGEVG
jgi:mono/diheme cytochrome c family protein